MRDHIYRVWRYNDVPGQKPEIWLVDDPIRDSQAWFSLRVTTRGRAGARICELLDVFGSSEDPGFQRNVLACAVHAGSGLGADALEVKGLHRSWRLHLSSLGFVKRTLPSNPFLYKDTGRGDKGSLDEFSNWHLCSADGDAGI